MISGGKATGFFRQTGEEKWGKMGQADLPAKGDAKIGLNAAGGPKDTDRWARFRELRILEQADLIKDIAKNRDVLNARLAVTEKRYRAQFTALDGVISKMSTTSSFLTQQLANLNK